MKPFEKSVRILTNVGVAPEGNVYLKVRAASKAIFSGLMQKRLPVRRGASIARAPGACWLASKCKKDSAGDNLAAAVAIRLSRRGDQSRRAIARLPGGR
jgi:hypothetical protein